VYHRSARRGLELGGTSQNVQYRAVMSLALPRASSGSLLVGGGETGWEAAVPRVRYFLILLAQYIVWLACYLAVNALTAGRSVGSPLLAIERQIPLLVWAYPVYASVYFAVVLPLFLCRTRRSFARLQIAVALASLLAFAVFVLAPMPYPRPHLGGGAMEALLAMEYQIDQPRCTFPSLHVAIAWLLYLGMRDAPGWRTPLLLFALGVAASTLLVKQHFVVDVVAGWLLAELCWRMAPSVGRRVLGS
jgi:membrane-associated phospholipid phosphatase